MKYPLSFVLNGSAIDIFVNPTDTLLDVLKEKLNVQSPKRGCDTGDCGSCTVLLNGNPIRSCLTIALTVSEKHVQTVESFVSNTGELHPIQKAFHDHGATQCGFCTPGMLISTKVLLDRNPYPSREEIVEAISGHLCRCGTYLEIIEAIQAVVAQAGKEK